MAKIIKIEQKLSEINFFSPQEEFYLYQQSFLTSLNNSQIFETQHQVS